MYYPCMDKERKVWVSAQMTPMLRYQLQYFADEHSITRSEVVRRACEQYLGTYELDEVLDNHAAWIRTSEKHVN